MQAGNANPKLRGQSGQNMVKGKAKAKAKETMSLAELMQSGLTLQDVMQKEWKLWKDYEAKRSWFHSCISRGTAEKRLLQGERTNGLFLVRESSNVLGDFVLSLVFKERVIHYHIHEDSETEYLYSVDKGKAHAGLETLIDHYQQRASGLPTKLMKPCPGKLPPAAVMRYGFTNLLHKAVRECDEKTALEILNGDMCPDVDSKDSEGCNALHYASQLGLYDVADKLLDKKADTDIRDVKGHTALQLACMNNRPNIVSVLCSKGEADPQISSRDTGNMALHEAAQMGHVDCVRILLAMAAPCWVRNFKRESPYDLAIQNKHDKCAQILDEYKCPPAKTHQADWLHGQLDRKRALEYLEKFGLQDGLFLIRPSSRKPNEYVLAMTSGGNPFNYKIENYKSSYFIDDGPLLDSIEHLVQHYCVHRDGLPCKLRISITPEGDLHPMNIGTSVTVSLSPYSPAQGVAPPLPPRDMLSKQSVKLSKRQDSIPTERSPPGAHPITPTYSANYVNLELPKAGNKPLKLDASSIELGYEIGQGEFGSVLKGKWTNPYGAKIDVAIKTLHEEHLQSGRESFLREAEVMVKLDHPCIVKLIGISEGPPIMLVQELVAKGSLLDFLLDYPEEIDVETDLYLWAAQIACGMMYLEKQRFVHRDLAARNILLAAKRQVKVGDFGLSRACGTGSDYYQASVGGRWPLKWYAPESVNYGTFSSASDVWSYGVTLWEMFSLGDQPYGDMTGSEVVTFLGNGGRLSSPDKCPDKVYDNMLRCWSKEPSMRPSFQELNHHFLTDPEYVRTRPLVWGREGSLC